MTQALAVLRRSALEDSDCLYRFNEIHRKGVDDSGDYAIRGQAFALIKHLYIDKLIAKHVPSDFEEATAAFVEGIGIHQTPNRLIPELRELWVRHAESFTLDLDRVLTYEERVVGDGVSWAPDLVYAHPGELEIRDDKTYWITLTEDEVKATYQARFYAWRAMKTWPNFPQYRVTFVFVRFNKVTSVVFTQAEIDQMQLEVEADIARVRYAELHESWPANAGPSCRYCELRCPLVDNDVVWPSRIVGKEMAEHTAGLVLVGDKMLKTVKKALKAWATVNGPIRVNGVEWANRPILERKYPVQVVLETLRARNLMGAFEAVEGKGELTLSYSSLSKLFKEFPQLEKDLAPAVIAKTTYRFSGKIPKIDDDAHAINSAGGDEE